MKKADIRQVWGRVNGANVAHAAREDINRLRDDLGSVHEELTRATQQIHEGVGVMDAKLQALDALNKQLIAQYLEKIFTRDKRKKSLFILGGHEWGNIGDLAIGYSETTFLENNFPDYNVFSISRLTLLSNWQRIVTTVSKDDVIVIHGGGNMGDIWPREEFARRKIIETFKGNTVVSFPQSIKFSSEEELVKSAQVYNSHKKLLIALRDDASYEIAKQYYTNCKVVRTEDIVMTYEYPVADWNDWDRVLFVMRDDVEKRANSGIEKLRDVVSKELPYHTTDTVIPGFEFISTEYGAKLVYQKVDELHSAKVVVTDRLHGAIFALQAGRPVIVFDNTYGKIKGALKSLNGALKGRILFANEDGSNITIEDVKKLYALPETDVTPYTVLNDDMRQFATEIKNFIAK